MGLLKDWGISYSTQLWTSGIFIFLACIIAWLALRSTDARPLQKSS